MPGTVDDFMNRFGGGGTIDDNEAQQYHDRFVSTDSKDRDFDNQTYHKSATEYLGKLPDDQFQDAARTAYNQAAPQERQGLLGGLLAAVTGGAAGGGISEIAKQDRPGYHRSQPNECRRRRTSDELHTIRASGGAAEDGRRKAMVCQSDG